MSDPKELEQEHITPDSGTNTVEIGSELVQPDRAEEVEETLVDKEQEKEEEEHEERVFELPEGCAMMVGDDGEQYVTIVQGDQTYAIPINEYHAMQQEGGVITLQTAPEIVPGQTSVIVQEEQQHHQVVVQHQPEPVEPQQVVTSGQQQQQLVMVPVTSPPPFANLQPVSGPPPSTANRNAVSSAPMVRPGQQQQYQHSTFSPGPVMHRNFKPIRVDNWGIFVLNRLQSFFQKKEYCDLTLRFSSQNAQIKVHKLVLNSCTDFLQVMQKEGKVEKDVIEMPEDLTANAVAPIIRFMYTGKLEVKGAGVFGKLHETALRLNMTVLSKLMDAQLNAPLVPDVRKPGRRRSIKPEDPLKQMKKIKKIEKRIMNEEKKARLQAKMEAQMKQEQLEYEDSLPGKKLPIWKKRSNHVDTPTANPRTSSITIPTPTTSIATTNSSASKLSTSTTDSAKRQMTPSQMKLTPVSHPPPGARLVPLAGPPPGLKLIPQQPKDTRETLESAIDFQRSYKRQGVGEKPKVLREIREIQENLTFEKIRKTGVKNVVSGSEAETVKTPKEEMTVEEIKEFMEEQRKRLQQIGDDDDYHDNYAGLDFEADYEEEEEEDDEDMAKEHQQLSKSVEKKLPTVTPSKPILKTEKLDHSMTSEQTPTSRKSVRFSLRPGAAPASPIRPASPETITSNIGPEEEDETPITETAPEAEMSPPKKSARLNNLKHVQVDDAVDEFNKAVEAEMEAAKNLAKRSGTILSKNKVFAEVPRLPKKRGRPYSISPKASKKAKLITPTESDSIDLPIPNEESSNGDITIDLPTLQSSTDTKKDDVLTKRPAAAATAFPTQAQVIQQLLQKNPNLFKDNSQVKLKIMVKDGQGNPQYQWLTLKKAAEQPKETVPSADGDSTKESADEEELEDLIGYDVREVPKVKYTGRRGRPKKLKPGEPDPHALERQEIIARLNPGIDQEHGKKEVIEGSVQVYDPSSEAEALSHVASGIATSLGLVESNSSAAIIVPSEMAGQVIGISDLSLNYEESSDTPYQIIQTTSAEHGAAILVTAANAIEIQERLENKNNIEDAMAKLHGGGSANDKKSTTTKEKEVSKIAMDWDEDEEDV